MPGESIAELRERLALLRELGASSHDPSTGRVTFWAPAPDPVPSAQVPTLLASEAASEKATEGELARRRRRADGWLLAATEGLPDGFELDDDGAH